MTFRHIKNICNYLTLLLMLTLFCNVSNSALYAASHRNRYETKHRHEITVVRKLIANCPGLHSLFLSDINIKTSRKRKIFKIMDEIATYPDNVIELAVKEYVARSDDASTEIDRVFLLTKYLYNVPRQLSRSSLTDQTDFLLAGAPYDAQYVNSMWPLFYNNNHLDITDPIDLEIHYCPGAAALYGFKYCRLHFGRRLNRKHI